MVGAPALLPIPGTSSSKEKARITDRQRRQRIADNLKALHELLPNSAEEQSGSRLQTESTAIPLVFYEIMGKLLEEHSAAAGQLLESKGLFLLPMALVDELSEAMQRFVGSALV
ncbi:unnamed protein product [Sphenostylis stenocarpa]|uniref:BHLH domain-containing protein n=1 Tax=Sphenostylis stenocarpa TaxID=92480 RepID=A0AA86SPP4_9FABA|nr:unnamed protein product [Sphenostylis stenocarpa]